jgi:hypothetical protein
MLAQRQHYCSPLSYSISLLSFGKLLEQACPSGFRQWDNSRALITVTVLSEQSLDEIA